MVALVAHKRLNTAYALPDHLNRVPTVDSMLFEQAHLRRFRQHTVDSQHSVQMIRQGQHRWLTSWMAYSDVIGN